MKATGSTPGYWKPRIKIGIIVFGLFVVALGTLWTFIFFSMKPPKEKKLIANFYAHHAAYESLRDMLLADQQVDAVWVDGGVETTDSGFPRKPPEVNFPIGRYNEYVALLEQVGSNAVFKGNGNQLERVCVGAWGAGFAADTRHVWVCWTDREPANQVSNLDDYYRDPKRPHNVLRHIDGNWYLRADW